MELITWLREEELDAISDHLDEAAARMEATGLRGVMPQVIGPDTPLGPVAEALKRREIELHPWIKPTFGVKDPVCRVMTDPEAQRRRFGTDLARGCLSNRSTLEKALDAIRHFVEANEGLLDGLHLDYVRNDNALFLMEFPCQCEACREERMLWLGRGELAPEDMKNPCIAYKELSRRNDRITRFVREVRALTREHGLALSLAARANYIDLDDIWEPPVYGLGPAVFEGQDWAQWAAEGLFDFICTMNYHTNRERFGQVARNHARLLSGADAVFYSGIGVESSMGECDPDLLRALLEILTGMDVRGASIFSWGAVGDEHAEILKSFR